MLISKNHIKSYKRPSRQVQSAKFYNIVKYTETDPLPMVTFKPCSRLTKLTANNDNSNGKYTIKHLCKSTQRQVSNMIQKTHTAHIANQKWVTKQAISATIKQYNVHSVNSDECITLDICSTEKASRINSETEEKRGGTSWRRHRNCEQRS